MAYEGRLGRDLFLSFVVHALLWALFLLMPSPPKQDNTITFEVVPPASQRELEKARSVVRSTQAPDLKQTDEKEAAQFLSDKTARVHEQTKAERSGLTQNRQNRVPVAPPVAPRPQQVASQPKAQPQAEKQTTSPDGLARFLPKKIEIPKPNANDKNPRETNQNTNQQSVAQQQPDLNPGFSTLAEDLSSDIKTGDITALNTDRYLYYSYFARAQELLWNEWAPHIQSALVRPPSSLTGSPHSKFLTVIEVWFWPNGQVHSTHILKPSGITEFDRIAEASFHNVRVIPNPPRERIEADGLIRFKWGLTVDYDPRAYAHQ